MADPQLLQRAADLGQSGPGDLPAGLGGVEVMAAPIGVELDEQAMALDHLGQATEGRGGALLLDQHGGVERRGRVIQRDHQVERRPPGQPGMRRGILVQHHADHRPPRPLAPVRPALARRRHRAAPLQPQPGRGVAQRVAVPPAQHVVEMPDREPGIMLVVELQHPLQLVLGRPPWRRLAHPPIDQTRSTFLAVAPAPAPEGPLAHAQRRGRLGMAQHPPLHRSSSSSKRMIPILERIPARPSRPSILERL